MSTPDSTNIARKPRHATSGDECPLVDVAYPSGPWSDRTEAELVNLSRDGFQLRVPTPIDSDGPIGVRLSEEKTGVDLTLIGTIRWQVPSEKDRWLIGCSSETPLDWETLGELFLGQVLSVDPPDLP